MSAAEGLDAVAHDLLRDLRAVADSAFEDPAALETVEQRLTTLGELKRKYGRTLDDVLEFGAGASAGHRSWSSSSKRHRRSTNCWNGRVPSWQGSEPI